MPNNCSPEQGEARDVLAARALPGLGVVGLARALSEHESASAFMALQSDHAREQAYADADGVLAALRASGARAVACTQVEYPAMVRDLADAPAVLFARGALPIAEAPSV